MNEIKLSDMVVVVKLSSGELIMALCDKVYETALSLSFPYEIVNKEVQVEDSEEKVMLPVLFRYCPFTENRIFVFNARDVMFAKDASAKYSEVYLKTVMTFDKEEFLDHIEDMKVNADSEDLELVDDYTEERTENEVSSFSSFDTSKTIH